MEKQTFGGRKVEIMRFGGPVIFMPVSPNGSTQAIADFVRQMTGAPFTLCGFDADDWNAALTPWLAKNPFGGVFSGKAGETLCWLETFAETFEAKEKYVAGYSLGGLFALWTMSRSKIFSGAACCSGSLWYPGLLEELEKWTPAHGTRLYFSLGDREPRTRSPMMACIGTATADTVSRCREKGAETVFEWNPGNHFREPDLRTAKGIAWLLRKP